MAGSFRLHIMSFQKYGPIGIGRGARRPPYVSDSFQPPRSSTPTGSTKISSPSPPKTPDGVLTQVQQRQRKTKSPVPSIDSNNTDDLFDDSFEFDDADFDIPSTNLTQEFPKCRVQEQSNDEPKNNPKDILEKVLLLSNIGICNETTFQVSVENSIRGCKRDFSIPTKQNVDEEQNYPSMIRKADPQSAEFDAVKENWTHPMLRSPKLVLKGSVDNKVNRGDDDDLMGEKRSASDTEEWKERKKLSRDERDGQRFSDDLSQYNESETGSALLSESQIMNMLGCLTPDPKIHTSNINIERGETTSKLADKPDIKTWGIQVPLEVSEEQLNSSVDYGSSGLINIHLKTTPADYGNQISTAVRQVRHALVKMVDGVVQETGLEKHDFGKVSRDDVPVNDEIWYPEHGDVGGKINITIPEVISRAHGQVDVTFETPSIAKFLMVARNTITAKWTIPSRQRFHDVINQVENHIRREKKDCLNVLAWNSEWQGGIGLLGLRVRDLDKLQAFRETVSGIQVGDMVYNTYPKELLDYGNEVSVFLHPELRCFDLEFLPISLFEKNRLLGGNVTVRYSKHLQGQGNMRDQNNDGKVVILEGDEEFLLSL